MSVSFTGPIKGRAVTRGNREWFSCQPMSQNEVDYVVWTDDFLPGANQPTSSGVTNCWTAIMDGTSEQAIVADELGGAIILQSGSQTENTGASLQLTQSPFEPQDAKQLWFEAKVKLSDGDQCDAWVGLSTSFASNPEAVLTAINAIGFRIADGDATWQIVSRAASAATSTDSAVDVVDNTYQRLGFHYNGNKKSIDFFIDRAKVGSSITNICTSAALTAGIMILNGMTAEQSITCDYMHVVCER